MMNIMNMMNKMLYIVRYGAFMYLKEMADKYYSIANSIESLLN